MWFVIGGLAFILSSLLDGKKSPKNELLFFLGMGLVIVGIILV